MSTHPADHDPGPTKVIIAGFPMKLCSSCDMVWGFWSWVVLVLPWNSVLTYTGSYWHAFPRWLKGPSDSERGHP